MCSFEFSLISFNGILCMFAAFGCVWNFASYFFCSLNMICIPNVKSMLYSPTKVNDEDFKYEDLPSEISLLRARYTKILRELRLFRLKKSIPTMTFLKREKKLRFDLENKDLLKYLSFSTSFSIFDYLKQTLSIVH